jgi:ferrous iron transport protein B
MSALAPSIVLAGFESAGKTALFRRLTGEATGHEANFRGSTVSCRSCHSEECQCEIIDTPGMRLTADTLTTRLALEKVHASDTVLLVVRGTNLQQEIEGLLHEINASTQRLAMAVTFADKDEKQISTLAAHYREALGVPVVALNARDLSPVSRTRLLAAIQQARLPITTSPAAPESSWKLVPSATWFEHRSIGSVLALLVLALLWIVPVIAAFQLADFFQPIVDEVFIGPVTDWLNARLSPLATTLLTGGYGILKQLSENN